MRVVFSILILLAAFPASVFADKPARPPAAVTVVKARLALFTDRIEALGTLRANESVELTATIGERVVETGFADGQRVEAGHILVKLSSTE